MLLIQAYKDHKSIGNKPMNSISKNWIIVTLDIKS